MCDFVISLYSVSTSFRLPLGKSGLNYSVSDNVHCILSLGGRVTVICDVDSFSGYISSSSSQLLQIISLSKCYNFFGMFEKH